MYRVYFKVFNSYGDRPTECSRLLSSYTEVNNFKFYCTHKYGHGTFDVRTVR